MIKLNCIICEKQFIVHECRKDTAKVCSRSCNGVYVGKLRRERAKPRISTQGYYFIKKLGHHRSNKQGYVKVADIVLEEKLGRRLGHNEIAHHINGDKLNDTPENLEAMDNAEHTRMHHDERRKRENTRMCIVCGKNFYRTGRKRPVKFCSRKCMAYDFSHRSKNNIT